MKRYQQLVRAFTQELFACHFLTDLFASGHMRTPRRALVNYVSGLGDEAKLHVGIRAGFLAQAMHDEDNEHGLWVESDEYPWSDNPKENKAWKAYGDHGYLAEKNAANKAKILEVVEAALLSIYDKYREPEKEPTFNPARYIPRPISVDKIAKQEANGGERNYYPLFEAPIVDGKRSDSVVTRRKSITNRWESGRKENWRSVSTLFKVKLWHSSPETPETLSDEQKRQLHESLEIRDEVGTIALVGNRCVIQ